MQGKFNRKSWISDIQVDSLHVDTNYFRQCAQVIYSSTWIKFYGNLLSNFASDEQMARENQLFIHTLLYSEASVRQFDIF